MSQLLETKIDKLPERARRLIRDETAAPRPGHRHQRLVEVAYDCAEAGFTNDEILTLLRKLGQDWGNYPACRLYRQWTKLLQILERARQKYPNAPDGSGYQRVVHVDDVDEW